MVIQIDRQPDNVAPNEAFGGKVPVECFFYRICIEGQPVAAKGVAAVCCYQRGTATIERVFRVMADEDVDVEAFDVQGFEDVVHENLPNKESGRFPSGSLPRGWMKAAQAPPDKGLPAMPVFAICPRSHRRRTNGAGCYDGSRGTRR